MPSSHNYTVESTLVRPSEQSEVYTEERKRYWEDYARSASKWVRLRSYYQFRSAEIYKLSFPPGMRVLELGCGTGFWTEQLAATANSVMATDINPEVMKLLKMRIRIVDEIHQ